MRKGQVEIIKVARRDTCLEFRDVGSGVATVIHPNMEDGVRLHLVGAHKERKAAKKAERRFYARRSLTGEFWIVQDRTEGHVTRASLPHTTNAESDAKAFARLLNKRNRKQATNA